MNKADVIDINTPVIARFAQLALLGEIQSNFNLYPGRLANHIASIAEKERCTAQSVADRFLPGALNDVAGVFWKARELLGMHNGEALPEVSASGYEILNTYFVLDPERIVKDLRNRIKQVGEDPDAMLDDKYTHAQAALICLHYTLRRVIEWVFQEAARIAEKQVVIG